jgi:hypothetical protein
VTTGEGKEERICEVAPGRSTTIAEDEVVPRPPGGDRLELLGHLGEGGSLAESLCWITFP